MAAAFSSFPSRVLPARSASGSIAPLTETPRWRHAGRPKSGSYLAMRFVQSQSQFDPLRQKTDDIAWRHQRRNGGMGIEYLNFRVADRVPAVRPGQHRDACLRPPMVTVPLSIFSEGTFTRRRQARIQTVQIANPGALPSASTV